MNKPTNNTPRIVTGKLSAWLDSSYNLNGLAADNEDEDIVNRVTYFREHADMAKHGYVLVGSAEVTITLLPQDTLVDAKITSLRAELSKERADSQVRCNKLEDQIANMLALTYEAPVELDDDIPF